MTRTQQKLRANFANSANSVWPGCIVKMCKQHLSVNLTNWECFQHNNKIFILHTHSLNTHMSVEDCQNIMMQLLWGKSCGNSLSCSTCSLFFTLMMMTIIGMCTTKQIILVMPGYMIVMMMRWCFQTPQKWQITSRDFFPIPVAHQTVTWTKDYLDITNIQFGHYFNI